MPFDGTGFPERCNLPRRPPGDDRAAIAIIVAIAFVLLVMPITLNVLGDIVRYARGH